METDKGAKDHLRLVLVGLQGVGKSATGNTILGHRAFQSDISSTCLTLQSDVSEGQVCGRQVTVVDTPGLFSNVLSDEEVKDELVRALTLCTPGPHIFLFVIQLGRFTAEERAVMDTLKEMMCSNVNLFLMVLFTYGDRLKNKTIDQFIKEDKNLQKLIHHCGGQYHVFTNTDNENEAQISELLEKIDSQVMKRKDPFYVKGLTVQKWEKVTRFAVPIVIALAFSALVAFIRSHRVGKNIETVITDDMTEKAVGAVLEQSESVVEAVLGQSESVVEAVLRQSEIVAEAVLRQSESAVEAVLGQSESVTEAVVRQSSETALDSVLDQPGKVFEAVLESEQTLQAVVDTTQADVETIWEKLGGLMENKTKVIPTVVVGLGAGLWILKKLLRK